MADGRLTTIAQSGLTYDDQPAFVWSKSPFWNETSHLGQPDEWRFPYVRVDW